MKRFILIACITYCVVVSPYVYADATAGQGVNDEAELSSLLTVLENQTRIATRTKLNADHVPGMVTVLYGNDLANKGVRTVVEALRLIPSFNSASDPFGASALTVRGTGAAIAAGSVKILLNDVSMNTAYSAEAKPILDMPIQQVERLEVLRGPGASNYGEYAFAGVVNVITKQEKQAVYLTTGSFDTYGGGGVLAWSNKEKDFYASLNFSGWKTGGADVIAGPDNLFGIGAGIGFSQFALSNAPGPANMDRENFSAILDIHYRDTQLLTQWARNGHGDNFGIFTTLPAAEDEIATRDEFLSIEARHEHQVSSDLEAEIRLGYFREKSAFDVTALPAGFAFWPINVAPFVATLTNDLTIDSLTEINRWYANLELIKKWNKHTFLLNLNTTYIDTDDFHIDTNVDSTTLVPLTSVQRFTDLTGTTFVIGDEQTRFINSFTIQDEFRLNDSITLTGSVRYSHFSDVENAVSPRLAAVYRLNNHHIFKAQYTRGFRPSTFLEKTTPGLESETNDTYEASYVYTKDRYLSRLTFYYAVLKNLISGSPAANVVFMNSPKTVLYGFELEGQLPITRQLSLNANFSLNLSEREVLGPVTDTPRWLGNLDVNYRPHPDWVFNVRLHHLGEILRNEVLDPRSDLDHTSSVDITVSTFKIAGSGLGIRLGVKNVFEEDIRDPSSPANDGFNNFLNAPLDYPRAGREWWLQTTLEF